MRPLRARLWYALDCPPSILRALLSPRAWRAIRAQRALRRDIEATWVGVCRECCAPFARYGCDVFDCAR